MGLGLAGIRRRPIGRTLKRAEQVAREILNDVGLQQLGPGSPLPSEAVMLKTYDVSRGTLREALRILEVYGLITIKPGPSGGPRLLSVSPSDFARTATFYYQALGVTFSDVLDARVLLEPIAARLVAQSRSDDDVMMLSKTIARAKAAESTEELLGFVREFHALIRSMVGNRLIALAGTSLEEVFEVSHVRSMTCDERARLVASHDEIADAIIDRDPEKAERLMAEHMAGFAEALDRENPALVRATVPWV